MKPIPATITRIILPIMLAVPTLCAASKSGDVFGVIRENSHELTFQNGSLSGPGLEWLAKKAENANYFLVGEQHGASDIIQASQSIFSHIGKLGNLRFVVEVGPRSVKVLEKLIRDPDPGALAAYHQRIGHRMTFPFYFWQEEIDLAKSVISLAGTTEQVLWGLDQEFVYAGHINLELLVERAQTAPEQIAVANARTAAISNKQWLGLADITEIDVLVQAFAGRGDEIAMGVVNDMHLSNRVYAPFTRRGGSVFLANREREEYMKVNFENYMREIRTKWIRPRIFAKMGANHLVYGRSPTRVVSLGTYIRETVRLKGENVFSIHIDCLGGLVGDPISDKPVPCTSYFNVDKGSFARLLSRTKPTLIDLAALRIHDDLVAKLDPKTRELVFSYDAYLSMPNVTPATKVH